LSRNFDGDTVKQDKMTFKKLSKKKKAIGKSSNSSRVSP